MLSNAVWNKIFHIKTFSLKYVLWWLNPWTPCVYTYAGRRESGEYVLTNQLIYVDSLTYRNWMFRYCFNLPGKWVSNLLKMSSFHLNSSEHFQFCMRLEMLNKHAANCRVLCNFDLHSSNFGQCLQISALVSNCLQIFRARCFIHRIKFGYSQFVANLVHEYLMWNVTCLTFSV